MSTRWPCCPVNKVISLVPLLFSLVLIGCDTAPSIDVHLVQTEAIQVQETRIVPIDNCQGLPGQPHLYTYPFAVGSVGVENLVPNGGEPFVSIRKRIWSRYGNQASGLLLLLVPAGMKSEFTVTATVIRYRGTVSGDLIDVNKVHPAQDAVYYYPFLARVVVSGQRDVLCP